MTRTIAGYIAAGYETDGKTENTALTAAATLSFDEVERALLKASAEAPQENAVGSFERLMGWAQSGGKRPGQ